MKLYKFRSLGSCSDLERVTDIVKTGKFWCSQFWELNDPMEGVYSYDIGTLSDQAGNEIFSAKQNRALCSFSDEQSLCEPLLWGYYGNGFKGVAIEVVVDTDGEETTGTLEPIRYVAKLPKIKNGIKPDDAAHRILTTKLKCWKHEREVRFLSHETSGLKRIGRITALHFGLPYGKIDNARHVHRLSHVSKYFCRARSLMAVAQSRNIPCLAAVYDNGRVVTGESIDEHPLSPC